MSRFTIGIDLGTTNSVLAYAQQDAEHPQIQLLEIPQLVAASTVESLSTLPSFVYLASEAESQNKPFDLSWAKDRRFAVGSYARNRAAEAPDRTVGAAKSWLCHGKVDRRQPILPWNAPADVDKISPVTASQRYLEHLIAAWQHQFPDAPINQQQVTLTVPASFDPVARELTREAALAAGLPADFILLEEPQAALYAWLASTGDRWRKMLKVNESILVCDIGGGTTDLTLITVGEEHGELVLQRSAVGNHLLVGGDNMDLALAHMLAEQFNKKGTKLNPWQAVSLWHSCRAAKESLLTDDAESEQTISVLGRGSKLIGGTVSLTVKRNQISRFLSDGFLPQCALTERPQRQPASGFQEIGVPYESDPAITRHIAAFISKHCTSDNKIAVPRQVLLNGGVFKADLFRDRLLQVMGSWSEGKSKAQLLSGVPDLDHAVAKGACYYGWSKQHGGIRIRGGTGASYYVGIETTGLAIPGAPRPLKALCVVPFGMEEGTQTDVPSGEIGLVTDQDVSFRFFSSKVRKQDAPGQVLNEWTEEELVETAPLETTLSASESSGDDYVPVKFQSRISELGMFELWCVATQSDQRWKLEFSVRDEADESHDG
jgi:molecular chaperone DnaK (HSP70)